MSSHNCGTDTVLPGFSFTVARPLFKLTSTDSTPATFFSATSTTWAQVIQSMPKMDRSTCSSSARPGKAPMMLRLASTESAFRIVVFLSFLEEISEVEGESIAFLRVQWPGIAIGRKLDPGFNPYGPVHSEEARAKKHLARS